jgi:hypothetical protein
VRISNLRTEQRGSAKAVVADVTWEDCSRPARTVHFETDEPFTQHLNLRPEAFVLSAMPAAMRHGEKRIAIDGSLCPRFRDNISAAMQVLHKWYRPGYVPLKIEARDGYAAQTPPAERRAASYLSLGVDSMATLFNNLQSFEKHHPARVRTALLVHGFDIGGTEVEGPRMHIYKTAYARGRELTDVLGIDLVPIRTNVKYLDDDWTFWTRQFFGAATLSIAHLFTGWIHEANLGSGSPIGDLVEWGSHPMLDYHYQSSAMSLRHDGVWMTRHEKIGLISQWAEGLNHLRVCLNVKVPQGQLNCGICEKCLRTMTGLVTHGALRQCTAFPGSDVTVEMIHSINIRTVGQERDWKQLNEPLVACGRTDLSDAIKERVNDWHKWKEWTDCRGFKGRLRKFDERFVHGMLTRMARGIR